MSDQQQIDKNNSLLRLIREDPAWALSRVQRAAELEAECDRLREAAITAMAAIRDADFSEAHAILFDAVSPGAPGHGGDSL